MTAAEQQAILAISLHAAFADGSKDAREREQIRQIAEGLAPDGSINMPALYQDVLLKRRTLEQCTALLESADSRQLAYEMAVCVCDADGVRSAAENAFLESLSGLLRMDPAQARALPKTPTPSPTRPWSRCRWRPRRPSIRPLWINRC